MSLKHAMLGFLSVQNMNGYQIKKHIDESISRFWSVSISQIYPTLNDMLEANLIGIEKSDEELSRGSKIYCITELGKQELKKWLTVPVKKEPFRSEMLLKLYFSSNISKDVVIEHLLIQKDEAEERLKSYKFYIEHIEKEHFKENEYSEDALYWRMTIRHGIYLSKATIEWCDECIEMLNQKEM